MKKLYIKSSPDGDLPLLGDIVSHLQIEYWSVLQVNGIFNGNTAPREWSSIEDSPFGLMLDSKALAMFDVGSGEGYTCVMDAVIIGYSDAEFIQKFASKEKMLANADLILDLTDGDSWLIESDDSSILERIVIQLASFHPQFISSDGTIE